MKFAVNQLTNTNYTLKENDEVTILGNQLSVKSQSQIEPKARLLHSLFLNIIWITYRKNFPPLLASISGTDYTSDTGWGCMIRVGKWEKTSIILNFIAKKGQMMFSQALKKTSFFRTIEARCEWKAFPHTEKRT